jgi:hypothetical protein
VDKVEGLDSDLMDAVEVCYERGATEYVRLNYPKWFERFEAAKEVAYLASLDYTYKTEDLHDADAECTHAVKDAPGGGVKCIYCPGWFCY